ncbi:hypothetical protein PENSPDRAFT_192367 [Peniophora sp. CONT]|nr:hypothetical protein PENSPDRAFT_192367 [Peniophora sp. CONT]
MRRTNVRRDRRGRGCLRSRASCRRSHTFPTKVIPYRAVDGCLYLWLWAFASCRCATASMREDWLWLDANSKLRFIVRGFRHCRRDTTHPAIIQAQALLQHAVCRSRRSSLRSRALEVCKTESWSALFETQ